MLEPTFRHCLIHTFSLKLLLRTTRKPNPNSKGNLLAHIIFKKMSQGDLQASLDLQPNDIPRPMPSSSLAHGCRRTHSGLSTRWEKPSSLNTRSSGSPTITWPGLGFLGNTVSLKISVSSAFVWSLMHNLRCLKWKQGVRGLRTKLAYIYEKFPPSCFLWHLPQLVKEN